uniref:Uncharacterized protein n=1 Tax=Heliothis virescens TaxID=7102 RepID=A0A2A4J922_HELVI
MDINEGTTADDLWTPYKELVSVVEGYLAHEGKGAPYAVHTFESVLRRHKQTFLSLFKNPPKNPASREEIKRGITEGVNLPSIGRTLLSKELVDEAIIISAEEEFKEIIFSKDGKSIENNRDYGLEINMRLLLPDFEHSESYHVFEKRCLKMLLQTMQKLSQGQTLLVQNINMSTHFNVSIIYIITKKCFEKIGFTSENTIILKNLKNKSALHYLELVDAECDKMKIDGTKDVLNSLMVQTTNVGDFYNSIIFYNNTFYRNKCLEYLTKIEKLV